MTRARDAWPHLAAVLVFLVLAVVQTGIWDDLGTRVYGGGRGDPGHDVYVLNWVTSHLHRPSALFEGRSFYPSRHAVLYEDPLIGPAVLVLPFSPVTRNPVFTFNAAILLALVVASMGFHLLTWTVTRDYWPALLAGVAIPYGAQQTAHIWHLNLLTISFFPFVMLAILRLFERPSLKWAVVLGGAFGLQATTSGYHALNCTLVCIVFASWGYRQFLNRRIWIAFGLAVAVSCVLLIPYVTQFRALRSETAMVRPEQETAHYTLSLPGSLVASNARVWENVDWAHGATAACPGLVVLGLALVALVLTWKNPLTRLFGALAIVSLLLALGPQPVVFGHRFSVGLFTLALKIVPFFGAVRHPITLSAPGLMAIGMLAALGLHALRERSTLMRGLLVAAAAGELLITPPARKDAPLELPEVHRFLQTQPAGAIVEVPIDNDETQWWTMWHGMPVANGALAFEPDRWRVLEQRVLHEWKRTPAADLSDSRSVAFLLAQFPVRYLVVRHEVPHAIRANVELTRAFELIHETPAHDRAYRIRRLGAGTRLVRVFRADQLGSIGPVLLLKGPSGLVVRVSVENETLTQVPMTGDVVRAVVPRPQASQPIVELEIAADQPFELLDALPGDE